MKSEGYSDTGLGSYMTIQLNTQKGKYLYIDDKLLKKLLLL